MFSDTEEYYENDVSENYMEGVGNEVLLLTVAILVLILLPIIFLYILYRRPRATTIHPDQQEHVDFARQLLQQRRSSSDRQNIQPASFTFRNLSSNTDCPICLTTTRFAVETNCGHVFCAQCILLYWRHGTWLGAVNCPVCRQEVHILLPCFTEADLTPEEMEERQQHIDEINGYNRRFSGLPRPLMDHIRDMPTLLRHLWSEFFSVSGLMWMFRLRIILCFVAAVFYLASPLDIIPEAIFGLLGLLDDVFVVLLLVVYVTIIYRNFLATRDA